MISEEISRNIIANLVKQKPNNVLYFLLRKNEEGQDVARMRKGIKDDFDGTVWPEYTDKEYGSFRINWLKRAAKMIQDGSKIITKLVQEKPNDVIFFLSKKNEDPPGPIAAKRNEIKQNFDATIWPEYTDKEYGPVRLDWLKQVIKIIQSQKTAPVPVATKVMKPPIVVIPPKIAEQPVTVVVARPMEEEMLVIGDPRQMNVLKRPITLDQINLNVDRLSINRYELNHSCQFPNFIRSSLSMVPPDFDKYSKRSLKMRQHQEVSKQYMISLPILKQSSIITSDMGTDVVKRERFPLTPYRGALLYHDMGTGKTLTGIHIAMNWINEYRLPMLEALGVTNYQTVKQGKVIFMFLKRLESTWSSSIYRYLNEAYDLENYFLEHYNLDGSTDALEIMDTLQTIYGSSNLLIPGFKQQIINDGHFPRIHGQIIKTFTRDHITFLFADPTSTLENHIANLPLEHNLVVVDEIHNIVSYIHSALLPSALQEPSKVGKPVYDWFMESKDTKIVGLSGTPIINKPSELLVLANILRGKMVIEGDDYESLFSLDLERIRQIVYDENNEILNPELLSRRLTGLISRKIRDASFDYPVSFWSSTLPWNDEQVPWEEDKAKLLTQDSMNGYSSNIVPLSIGNIRKINIPFSERQFIAYQKTTEKSEKYTEGRRGGFEGGAFTTRLGLSSYPLDSSLLYEIKLADGFSFAKCNENELIKRIGNLTNSPNSLFSGMAKTEKIDPQLLLINTDDAKKFVQFICQTLIKTEIELYNATINAIQSSESDPTLLHDNAVLRALELYRNVATTREYRVNRFVYNKNTVADDSPKIARMLETILDQDNKDLHFIFSHTKIYGAFHVEGYLQANGFEQYRFKKQSSLDPESIKMEAEAEIARLQKEVAPIEKGGNGRKFYIKYTENYQFIRNGKTISGPQIPDSELIDTIDYIYNNHANKHGELIKVLIGTKKAKEGLDLKHVRQVYIMDPWWNMVSVEQAMGRSIRYLSHEGFPNAADRYVKIDLLIGVFSENQITRLRNESTRSQIITVDERAFTTAINKLETSRSIDDILNKSAFDCGLYTVKSTSRGLIDCVNRFETTETGISYVPRIQNESIDIEFYQSRDIIGLKYFKVTIDGKDYFRNEKMEDIVVEYQTKGGLRNQKAERLFYEDFQNSGILIPAFVIVDKVDDDKSETDKEYLQIKYPAFKIISIS